MTLCSARLLSVRPRLEDFLTSASPPCALSLRPLHYIPPQLRRQPAQHRRRRDLRLLRLDEVELRLLPEHPLKRPGLLVPIHVLLQLKLFLSAC